MTKMVAETKETQHTHLMTSSGSNATDRNRTKNGGRTSRPLSFYDNCMENGNNVLLDSSGASSAGLRETQMDEGSPTQAHCLTTTVPQNITAQNIANKHTPTRQSLRHSRMIAMNKNGRVPKKYLPAIIRYHKLAKALLGLIILLGCALCFLALWLFLLTPNLNTRDMPYWSGVPVLLSGVIGLTLLCCFRKEHPGMKKSYFIYSIKVLSILISTVAAVASFVIFAFAVIHLVALYTMTCSSTNTLDKSCICSMESSSGKNETVSEQRSYHYVDLSCAEVNNILTILIIFSCATTFIAGILEVWYVYLHWASRYVYTYSKVRTDENTPTVFTNNTR